MSFSGGVFSINSVGQPVVTGTTISSTVFNALTADLATGLSTAILKDGTQIVTANVPMGGFRFTGMGAGSANTDSVRKSQVGQVLLYATTCATVSALTVTSILSSAYQQYLVRFSHLRPATDNTALFVRVSTDNGATYKGDGDYHHAVFGLVATATAAVTSFYATTSASGIGLGVGIDNVAGSFLSELIIDNPSSTTAYKTMSAESAGFDGNARIFRTSTGGTYIGSTSAISALQFVLNSGDIAEAQIAVYGINFVSAP